MTRRGNSDYIDTNVGPRPVRVFNAAAGTWRVTNLGKRWFQERDVPPPWVPLRGMAFRRVWGALAGKAGILWASRERRRRPETASRGRGLKSREDRMKRGFRGRGGARRGEP